MYKKALKQAVDRIDAIIEMFEDSLKPFDARCYVGGALRTEIDEAKAALPELRAALEAAQKGPEIVAVVSHLVNDEPQLVLTDFGKDNLGKGHILCIAPPVAPEAVPTRQPAAEPPKAGDGASLSRRLKHGVDSAIVAQCGCLIFADNAARKEVFALIDEVCTALDSPPPALEPVKGVHFTDEALLAINHRQALLIQGLQRMLDKQAAKVRGLEARVPVNVPFGYRLIPEVPTDALMRAGWAEGWSAFANYFQLMDAAAAEVAARGYTEVDPL